MEQLPMVLAQRAVLMVLCDALPTHERIVLHDRLLALVSDRAAIPGVVPGTVTATEVRAELDGLIRVLQRSALASLAE